ncbi:NERD domain-containing protein [Thiobacillus sp.]|uniref:nuclease-related domain-containing protein n=1 Tax=Thiobacillus sp. TaxID=924 RepID=UPI0025D9A967|nr:NERD domain-containing protein [Thiobacillus sp.]
MILKSVDKKDDQIADLERLGTIAPADRKAKIEQELRAVRAGLKAEQEAAYLIDFHLKDSKNTLVIHDLRLDVGGRVAQIDHLLLHRTLTVFVLETKSFRAGLKITDDGEFLRWNDYKKTFEGMASPVAQNERHVLVLKDAFKQLDMPTRLGMRLSPTFEPYVLVSPNARVDRPKKHETSRVLKADMLIDAIDKRFEKESVLETVAAMAKFVSTDTLQDIGRQLVRRHQPIKFDYAAKFGLSGMAATAPVVEEPAPAAYVADKGQTTEKPGCRSCSSEKLSIQYGKYGYYFKCADCDGNTPIKIGCGKEGHKERIRKDGSKFFRECEQCNSSALYFVNSN